MYIILIFRAALAAKLLNIPNLNMQRLPSDIIDLIDCPGFSEDGKTSGPKICAATGGSYFQTDSWNIFLSSAAIQVL
jgi:hypothetical protein